MYVLEYLPSDLLDIYVGMKLLDQGATIPFNTEAALIFILFNSAQVFQFFYILASQYLCVSPLPLFLNNSQPNIGGILSLWFDKYP